MDARFLFSTFSVAKASKEGLRTRFWEFSLPRTRVPHISRFSRDVGYHESGFHAATHDTEAEERVKNIELSSVVSHISRKTSDPKSAERSKFAGPHHGNALYQGTTLVGPLKPSQELGFSPWSFFLAR